MASLTRRSCLICWYIAHGTLPGYISRKRVSCAGALESVGDLLRLIFCRVIRPFGSNLFRLRFLLLGKRWPSLRGLALRLSLLSRRFCLLSLRFRLPLSGPARFRGGADFLLRLLRELAPLLWRCRLHGEARGWPTDHRGELCLYRL